MDEKMVSVIMPTYNRAYIIRTAIQSVLEQTYSNWELIIVDDGSEDETKQILQEYKDERIKVLINDSNKGANYSRNRGGDIAKGEFIAFLDSDNYWKRNKLEKQVKILSRVQEEVAFTFCREERTAGETRFIPDSSFDIEKIDNDIMEANCIDTNTVLMRRTVFNEVGGFDNNIPRLQDWELFLRIIKMYNYKVIYDSEVLNVNVLQKNSISYSNEKYFDAIIYILKKYIAIFTRENKLEQHFFRAINIAKNDNERKYFVNNFMDSFQNDSKICRLMFEELAKRYVREKKYHGLLIDWKTREEKLEDRSVLKKYFVSDNYSIAIYGLGKWGNLIYEELNGKGINVKCGIDRIVNHFHGIKIIRPDDKIENIDIIIVSIFQEFQEIKKELRKKFTGEIISIEEIINGIEC